MRIVSIKFREAGKRYDFNANGLELDRGMRVIVETDRGRALGTVVAPPNDIPDEQSPKDLKSVLRIASEEDLKLGQTNASREQEAFRFCADKIAARQMDMKLVRAEYLFDGSKIIFYFTADGRVDFRELVKDLAHQFHTRIEMRQIGVRDEAKLVGGLGVCGRELCCCTFLTEFNPVSVKMAKEQGLALNPTKISGQCGRLLCCLGYEFETYCCLKKGMPKCGKKVEFDGRPAEVLDTNILGQKLTLRFEDGQKVEMTSEEYAAGKLESAGDQKPQDKPEGRAPAKESGRSRQQRPRPASKERRPSADAADEVAPKTPVEAPATPQEGKPKRRRRRGRRRPKSE